MNEIGVVISRYYEDLRWVEEIKAPLDVYIYNRKGICEYTGIQSAARTTIDPKVVNDKNDIGNLNVETVKNNGVDLKIIEIPDDPGFESSTYAHHCYSRHDQLNDFTVFLQAHPTFYCRDIISKLNNPDSLKHTRYIPVNTFHSLLPPKIEVTQECIDFECITERFGWVDLNSAYVWSFYKNDFSKIPWLEFCKDMSGATIKDGKWMPPANWTFGTGTQFIVNKKRIQNHTIEYYKRMQQFCNTYVDPNPITPDWVTRYFGPGIMETIWQFAF